MNSSRHKKLLGLALGDKSLLVAEVAAADRPQVRKLAELAYPVGATPQEPAELGKALAQFIKDQGFSARAVIVGIPAKWLLVKSKDVPPADMGTLSHMLRLQAETEFSSELKDLVFDYADGQDPKIARSVLLLATQRKNVELAQQLCQAAGLKLAAVTPSVLALGRATGAAAKSAVLVLSVNAAGSELTSQTGAASNAIRHLRPLEPRPPFVSEMRRMVSALGGGPTADRELIVWDGGGLDAAALGEQLGFSVREGRLGNLGVDTAGMNGESIKFAPAIALATSGLGEQSPAVDFLHSRLAPPRERRLPRWAYLAAAILLVAIGGCFYAYQDMQRQQAELDKLQAQLNGNKTSVDAARAFVNKVSVAQAWHGGQLRYLACLRDLTSAIPNDGQTYATNFTLKEMTATAGAPGIKDNDSGKLFGQLDGKTTDQQRALGIPDRLKVIPAFSEVNLGGINYLPRERAVSFSLTFKYDPAKAAP